MDLMMWCKRNESNGPELYGVRNWETDRFPEFTVNKTIRILFSNKNWLPAFENKSYDQYGTVLLRRYDKEENHLRCLIEFEDQSVVDSIISDGHIFINDHRIKIEAMSVLDSDLAHMMNHLIVQSWNDNGPALNGNTFNLTELNDDCLLFIFRKLHPWTLWSLANTCVRFNELAKETFRLTYKRRQFRFCDVFTNYPIPLQQIEAFLKMFGSSIEKLLIALHEFNYFDEYRLNDVLLLVSGNCPHLKVLDIRKTAVDYSTWNECMSLFSQLESLNLKFANSDMNHVQPTVMPRLTSFNITTRHYEHMQSFLLNNWPLEELTIRSFYDIPESKQGISQKTQADWSTFFRLICEHCTSVKKLSILAMFTSNPTDDDFSTNVMRLSQLKDLRHLELNFDKQKVRPLLEKMLQNDIQLEYLHIRRADIGQDGADIISKFKTINTLKLEPPCEYTVNDLIGLVKRMPSLSTLRFSSFDVGVELEPILDHIETIIPLASNGKRLSNIIVTLNDGFGVYTDEKFEELLAIVKKRLVPIKLKVQFNSIRYGPHTVAHFSQKKSNSDLLIVESKY